MITKHHIQHYFLGVQPTILKLKKSGNNLTEQPQANKAVLWKGRANEPVDAFIIFTEDWG